MAEADWAGQNERRLNSRLLAQLAALTQGLEQVKLCRRIGAARETAQEALDIAEYILEKDLNDEAAKKTRSQLRSPEEAGPRQEAP